MVYFTIPIKRWQGERGRGIRKYSNRQSDQVVIALGSEIVAPTGRVRGPSLAVLSDLADLFCFFLRTKRAARPVRGLALVVLAALFVKKILSALLRLSPRARARKRALERPPKKEVCSLLFGKFPCRGRSRLRARARQSSSLIFR